MYPLLSLLIVITASLCAFAQAVPNTPADLRPCSTGSSPIGSPGYGRETIPSRGGSVDLGLALSGGGIRSASFNMGVIKALYDSGELDRVDVISSVSGGGYASYWLFSNFEPNDRLKFGHKAFDDDEFLKNICGLPVRNFFPLSSMAKAVFQKDKNAFLAYERSIHKTFGNGNNKKISYLQSSIESSESPYFIINTTRRSDEKNALCNVFEFTPTHMGSPATDFHEWSEPNQTVRWSEAVAMASAGIKWKLGRPIPDYAVNVTPRSNSRLSDGGYSENLGAFSLIRRGIKKIIIVDAGHDPKYAFTDYKDLRDNLRVMGINFVVPDIETFLSTQRKGSEFIQKQPSHGYAESRPDANGQKKIDSTIYYIKMSRLPSIISDADFDHEAYKRGETFSEEWRNALKLNNWHCPTKVTAPKGSFKELYHDLFLFKTKRYNDFLNKHWFWSKPGKLTPFFAYNFPHISTVDQTFFRDQQEALVGLGYLKTQGFTTTD